MRSHWYHCLMLASTVMFFIGLAHIVYVEYSLGHFAFSVAVLALAKIERHHPEP